MQPWHPSNHFSRLSRPTPDNHRLCTLLTKIEHLYRRKASHYKRAPLDPERKLSSIHTCPLVGMPHLSVFFLSVLAIAKSTISPPGRVSLEGSGICRGEEGRYSLSFHRHYAAATTTRHNLTLSIVVVSLGSEALDDRRRA